VEGGYIMISVTDRARQELKRILSDTVDMPQACLRVIDRGQGKLGLGIDIEKPGDELVEYDGLTVLVVEQGLNLRLNGVILDVDDTDKDPELFICHQWEKHRQN